MRKPVPPITSDIVLYVTAVRRLAQIEARLWAGPALGSHLDASLHTAEPQVGDRQTQHEAKYEGYARVRIARSSFHRTASGLVCNSVIQFPHGTGGGELVAWLGFGCKGVILNRARTTDPSGPTWMGLQTGRGITVQLRPWGTRSK